MSRTRLFALSAAASVVALSLSLEPAMAQQSSQPQQRPAAERNTVAKMDSTKFVKEAAVTDAFEIEAAKIALEKSRNDGVRRFAQHMIDEHTKMSAQLKSAAGNQRAATGEPAAEIDRAHRAKLDDLRKESGANFDRKYMEMQVQGHQQAAKLFENYSRNGDDAGLKKVATDALPHVKQHLQQAQTMQRQTAAAPAGSRPADSRPAELRR